MRWTGCSGWRSSSVRHSARGAADHVRRPVPRAAVGVDDDRRRVREVLRQAEIDGRDDVPDGGGVVVARDADDDVGAVRRPACPPPAGGRTTDRLDVHDIGPGGPGHEQRGAVRRAGRTRRRTDGCRSPGDWPPGPGPHPAPAAPSPRPRKRRPPRSGRLRRPCRRRAGLTPSRPSISSAKASANSWLRPPVPEPVTVTVVSPPQSRQTGRAPAARPCATRRTSPASRRAASRASPCTSAASTTAS